MRQAGTIITRQDAERFANYLLSLGISSKVEPAADAWAIWVHDENQLPRSKQELEQFQQRPQDPLYQAAEQAARKVLREAAEKKRQMQKNYVDMRAEWARPMRGRPVTMVLIVASVAVTLGLLRISQGDLLFKLPEILAGQAWRLVTPIFLHAPLAENPFHLLFNMFWLFDLGGMIERRLGSIRFALLVAFIAIASNYGQYLVTGPAFGGMSGVVFGLFGYAWVRNRLDPTVGLYMNPNTAFWMMLWFVACAVDIIPNVANWAHGVGLAAGALLGCVPHLLKQLRKIR